MQRERQESPLVSLVITAYNREAFIEQALQSAVQQDYPNLEIIISDNASTDRTAEIVKGFAADPRVKYFCNETNIGMIGNFDRASFQYATGDYITYVSSDDYLCNNTFVSEAMEIVKKDPAITLVFGRNLSLINQEVVKDYQEERFAQPVETGKESFLRFVNYKLGWGACIMHRGLIEQHQIFKPKITSIDFLANLLLMVDGNVGFVNRDSYVFRYHAGQASGNIDNEQLMANTYFVEGAYVYAKEKQLLPEAELNEWRIAMLVNYFKTSLIEKFIKNRKDYTDIKSQLKEKYPEVYARLYADKALRLFFASYTMSPFLTRILMRSVKRSYYDFIIRAEKAAKRA
jgi:glycosyltransferase involved in cell wall biosynthesis